PFRRLGHRRLSRLCVGEGQPDQLRRPSGHDPAARLGRDGDRPPARDAGPHRHDLALAALPALLRTGEGDEEPEAVPRTRDPGLSPAGAQGRRRGVKHSRNTLGALLTMLAMLCFAGMDAISKWLVADYAVGQMMWIRSALFCLFAWFVVRRQG